MTVRCSRPRVTFTPAVGTVANGGFTNDTNGVSTTFTYQGGKLVKVNDDTGHTVTLVPIAAVLVASIRLHFLDVLLGLKHRGPNVMCCDVPVSKGQELGWFQHGSTIIVFAPDGFTLCDNVREGERIRVGQPLMRLP
jgi:phosphatidylserine decarboxylase